MPAERVFNPKRIIPMIARYADRYCEEYLSYENLKECHGVDAVKLQDDWWEALKFFLSRVLYQGRSDDLSHKVEKSLREILEGYFDNAASRDKKFERLKSEGWSSLRKKLIQKKEEGELVGRRRDIDLVIDTLNFISRLPERNIVNYSVKMIEKGRLKELWLSFQKSKSPEGITSVGEKTASFYLRDLVVLFDLEEDVRRRERGIDQMVFLQPIDTWITKICETLEIGKGKKGIELGEEIVRFCERLEVSPIRFNMGAWYVGFHALQVLLEIFSRGMSVQ